MDKVSNLGEDLHNDRGAYLGAGQPDAVHARRVAGHDRRERLVGRQRDAVRVHVGEPLGLDQGLAKVLEVLLVVWSVGVFAALAGTLGAYFLQDDRNLPTR